MIYSKMKKKKIKIKKSTLVKIILILGIILFLCFAYTGINNYSQEMYKKGASQGVNSLVKEQTNSDKIFLFRDGEMVKIPLETLCNDTSE